RAPFEGHNAVQVVANVIDTPPARLSALRDDLPNGLERVVLRCLAKEPGDRFADYASLRNAMLPFSSVAAEPATQAQRTAAGWIDYLAAFLPTYAVLMMSVGPERLFIRPLYELSLTAWMHHLLVFAVGFAYFALTEGIWGAGFGKWIMNLRVVTARGKRPGLARAMLRILIPIAAIECVRIPLSIATLPTGEWTALNSLVFTALAVFSPWVVALLWIPARRSNGLATAWDLLSGTRVVVRPQGYRRPAQAAASVFGEVVGAKRNVGPFVISSSIDSDRWIEGEDPVLRRRVWLIRRHEGVASDARRAVARPGRARWLQEVRAEDAVWHVYEADRGSPISERLAEGPLHWPTLRFWLHDLAAELRAANRDGTLAASY
ncbi:MAG: RDD family protein, partial [Planctomycetota bacterium]